MQTLRKRTSPCKYKNDPSRFLGEGITFKAKLIGILEVSEARGDKMCQDALNDLKTAIRAAGEHKQRITISISIEGLKLRDEKSGDCLYHHPVHKISFIAQDMSDSRAFGYIFGSPDTGHRFFGIKTDKTASQVVISMRDLFQVVFELKKKEIEIAKHNSEQQQQQVKYGSSGYMDSLHFPKDESDADKGKNKYSQLLKSRCLVSKGGEPSASDYKGPAPEAIADLLDLEHELNSIQQGITQMEKMTPSDPFGPLAKPPDPYIDPFDDSFPPHLDRPPSHASSHPPPPPDDPSDPDPVGQSSIFGCTTPSSKASFFSQFSPALSAAAKTDDAKWFDQETESLFNESAGANHSEPISSPVALSASTTDPEQVEGKKSPVKVDLFTELDPLGTGRVKPYVDKKDFFQELKNPPKKVLKELITESSAAEPSAAYFPPGSKEDKTTKPDSAHSSSTIDSVHGFTRRYAKIDPFADSDPFDKADPFQEETFPALFSQKLSADPVFEDQPSWKFDLKGAPARADFSLFSSPALRVSLPPEKADPPAPIDFKSPPDSPENTKNLRRKNYHALKQTTAEGSVESPVQEEPFVSYKISTPTKHDTDRYYSSPPTRSEKRRMHSSDASEVTTPDPPPRAKTSLFFIKPPPLPPKKTAHIKPPARPPSLEDNTFHYDYLEKKEPPCKEELKCVKLKKQPFGARDSPPIERKQSTDTAFPVLPPPPNRKAEGKPGSARRSDKGTVAGSILNLKLNQLDNTGLENLAITLGIPSENIYSMTLQELTKMLADKYLISEVKTQQQPTDSFEVDFDANFAKMEENPPSSEPCYDKYAVFKELIENENKTPAQRDVQVQEDKYAALRQLSLTVDRAGDGSEEEDGGDKAASARPGPEELSSAINNLDLVAGIVSAKWSPPEDKGTAGHAEGGKSSDQEGGDGALFPLMDQFAGDQKAAKDNWATFEKSEFGETKVLKTFIETETSPLSSDGKEDVKEGGFHWQQAAFRKRTRKDVPWQDDDESWDDYSPKESFCSDESSHEERSPDPRRGERRYEKAVWEVCGRAAGGGGKWLQREKWTEETEDEFEESWRKQKERTNAYEFDRKTGFWHNSYDNCGKWCNSRSEPWEENDRHVHCYMSMRKRSESDNEYRKRCDSDASEKECVWTFQKSYQDTLGRSGKQKQYHGAGHAFRDCPEYCHESRAKHRKGVLQKRPSSASEPKRVYEKMCSPADYAFRSPDKDDYFRYQCARKDFRHRDSDFPHHHPDKRTVQPHAKTGCRASRGSGSVHVDLYPSPNKRNEPLETKNHQFDYFEPFRESGYKQRSLHPESESEVFEKSRKSASEAAAERPNQWASANGKAHDGFFPARAGDSFPKFPEESKSSPKKGRENGRTDVTAGPEPGRSEGRSKAHMGALHRQESAATLRKSESINIFSRDKDPFEGDDFFSSVS